ncbi:DUF1659 domain-containing protein [Caenibacillus caldisaponilyticus]|jgi:hypothetical protein|uniref:DUF1659 domain-containing protein n=1 Tax=Caenibacillus caldisaponilyticus TaxID=1674942 RepID=UPI0009884A01|nr:DUF1659 domain-containing protein [Caenibacillus caldisaponilyticus]
MATANLMDSSLILTLDAGVDEKGNPIVKRKTFNNLKTSATNDQLFAIGQALASVQQHPLVAIERSDRSSISA